MRDQDKAEGHAVRAVYLYSGMAEVAARTEDQELFAACEKLWENIVNRQMYVTGAIGATEHGEAFTFDYDLPNDTVYGETCAAIGLIFFARRMFEITKDGKYADVMERALYNGVISGMSLDGKSFFYVNPLEVVPEACEKDYHKRHVKPVRQKWFGCACCPPNIARLLSSLAGYAFEENEHELYVNLYTGGVLNTRKNGRENQITFETDYPWNGQVKITIENQEDTEFTLALRIPGWCSSCSLKINGEEVEAVPEKGYVLLNRVWKNGDTILLEMDMPVRLVEANPKVREDIGKAAVMRGPLVYCLEEADNGPQLQQVYLKEEPGFRTEFQPELLKGIMTIKAEGKRVSSRGWEGEGLYRTYTGKQFEDTELKFIPYYAWTNRTPGEMAVWVRV